MILAVYTVAAADWALYKLRHACESEGKARLGAGNCHLRGCKGHRSANVNSIFARTAPWAYGTVSLGLPIPGALVHPGLFLFRQLPSS